MSLAVNEVEISECRCPSCGGAVSVLDGQRRVVCSNCGLPLLALYDNYLPRYCFKDKLGREKALAKLRRALGNPLVDPAAARDVAGATAQLWWVPVYRFNGVVKSIQPGREKKWKITNFDYYHSAVAGGPYGFNLLKPGCFSWPDMNEHAQPVDMSLLKRSGTVLLPQHEDDDIQRELRRCWQSGGLVGPELLSLEKSIIYIPLWTVNFSLSSVRSFIVINGIDGSIFKARLPAKRRPGLSLTLSAGVAGLISGLVLAHYRPFGQLSRDEQSGWLVIFMICWLALAFAAAYFVVTTKCYFTVEWHDGKISEVRHGPFDPGKVALEQLKYMITRGGRDE